MNIKAEKWLVDFLTQIVQDGDWQHASGESMTPDAQRILQSIGVEVEPGVNESKTVEMHYEPVAVKVQLRFDNFEPGAPALMIVECGRIKFCAEATPGQVLDLIRGRSITVKSHLGTIPLLRIKNLKPFDGGRYVVLDVDTLKMPTYDDEGFVVSAESRLAQYKENKNG